MFKKKKIMLFVFLKICKQEISREVYKPSRFGMMCVNRKHLMFHRFKFDRNYKLSFSYDSELNLVKISFTFTYNLSYSYYFSF